MRKYFKSLNFDLIYGLPKQTRQTVHDTLEAVKRMSPDRIAFSVLGHRPDVFAHNQQIDEKDLPGIFDKALMWQDSMENLVASGYERIGMDHFARHNDELTIAKRENRLFRNSMGYSPGRFEDNIAIGPSGMTRMANYYFQDLYQLRDYYGQISRGEFPVFRGYKLNKDDLIRRDIMNKIMTYYRVDVPALEQTHGIHFDEYFRSELQELAKFGKEGILDIQSSQIVITELGTLFMRHVCAVFDNLGKDYKHNVETGVKSC